MSKQNILDKKGFAKVPHGIADAAISDTLKLLLFLCYDRPADWTYSVVEVARTMGKTPQCIRKHFRLMIDAGAFTRAGTKPVRHGIVPIYSFQPEEVAAVVASQLKMNPETDPETDVETNPETNAETNTETGGSHTNNHIPTSNTKNDGNKIETTKASSPTLNESGTPAKSIGDRMAEDFESLFDCNGSVPSQPPSTRAAVVPFPSSRFPVTDPRDRIKQYLGIP